MKVLIIYAHPNPQSFNHAILESFTQGLGEARHTFEVVDLYAIKFNAILNGEDFAMLLAGRTPDDIKIQQEKVSRAEGIVFIHPSWWSGPPAILKGWIDRVFSMGFAYLIDQKDGSHSGLLKNQKALVINTAGDLEEEAKKRGVANCMRKIEDEGVFGFCGIRNVQHVIFYNAMMTDDATRKGYLEEARSLGKKF